VNHQLQQLFGFGLKTQGFFCGFGHCVTPLFSVCRSCRYGVNPRNFKPKKKPTQGRLLD
jgi:hypothetical protein